VAAELKQYSSATAQEIAGGAEAFLMWSGHRGSEVYKATNLSIMWQQLCLSIEFLRPEVIRHVCTICVTARR